MITVSSNIQQVIGNLITKTSRVATPQGVDKLLRSVAISTAGDMAYRIHTLGQKADGSQIGMYSPSYMKIRMGTFSNNRVSRGKNKGKAKKGTAGLFTRGNNVGKQRPSYNRTSDTKIVFSLTRQMENDFGLVDSKEPIKTATGYAVGFKNPDNAKKAGYLEERFKGVYKLSEQERKNALAIAEDFVANAYQTR